MINGNNTNTSNLINLTDNKTSDIYGGTGRTQNSRRMDTNQSN